MHKYKLIYEVRKSAFIEAESETDAKIKAHEGDVNFEEDEITAELEVIPLRDDSII